MSRKHKITICSGTTCYVLGGASLMMLEDLLPPDLKDMVEIVGCPCLKACQDSNLRPPFVKINDYLMAEATFPKIIEYLRKA